MKFQIRKKNYTESKNLIKVLRKSIGEVISVTDGIGNIYKCEIINTDKISSTLSIINFDKNDSVFPKLSIAISLTKKTNRFEWFLEKATEIGIHEITPIISEHSEKSNLNIEGRNSSWLLIEVKDILIHIFTQESREFYMIEDLYFDCELIYQHG